MIPIDYQGSPAEHRRNVIKAGYLPRVGARWNIRGIDCFVMTTDNISWWIVAASMTDDDNFPDDGPYPSAEVAAVSATLQESL